MSRCIVLVLLLGMLPACAVPLHTDQPGVQRLLVSQTWDTAYVRAQQACVSLGLTIVNTQETAHVFTAKRPTGEQVTVLVEPGMTPRAIRFTGTPAHDVSDVVQAYRHARP